LTYFIVDYRNKCLKHRLFIRRLVKDTGLTEDEFIYQTSDYDILYTYGSWKIIV